MFENWSLSQYLVRFLAINHWGLGIMMTLFGIVSIFLNSLIKGFFPSSPNSLISITSFGIFVLIIGIYFCVMAYGLWNYKNYARIMQLILFYLLGVGVLIYFIITIITIFKSPIIGVVFLIITSYSALIVYMLIYLFQIQKDMVALFKGH